MVKNWFCSKIVTYVSTSLRDKQGQYLQVSLQLFLIKIHRSKVHDFFLHILNILVHYYKIKMRILQILFHFFTIVLFFYIITNKM